MGARLVRDGIGEVEWPRNPEAKAFLRPVRDDAEHDRLLLRKVGEEFGEFLGAETPEEQLDELADFVEAALTIVRRKGGAGRITDLADRMDRKFKAVGGFDRGLVWEV